MNKQYEIQCSQQYNVYPHFELSHMHWPYEEIKPDLNKSYAYLSDFREPTSMAFDDPEHCAYHCDRDDTCEAFIVLDLDPADISSRVCRLYNSKNGRSLPRYHMPRDGCAIDPLRNRSCYIYHDPDAGGGIVQQLASLYVQTRMIDLRHMRQV